MTDRSRVFPRRLGVNRPTGDERSHQLAPNVFPRRLGVNRLRRARAIDDDKPISVFPRRLGVNRSRQRLDWLQVFPRRLGVNRLLRCERVEVRLPQASGGEPGRLAIGRHASSASSPGVWG